MRVPQGSNSLGANKSGWWSSGVLGFCCSRIGLGFHSPRPLSRPKPARQRGLFLVRPIYTTPALWLAGFGPADDRFAQAFHQPFQVRHAFAEFTKLGAQRIDFPIQQPRW